MTHLEMIHLDHIVQTESLRSELTWLLPDMRVVVKSPGAHHDPGAGLDSLTVEFDVLGGQSLNTRHRSVQPEGFLEKISQDWFIFTWLKLYFHSICNFLK